MMRVIVGVLAAALIGTVAFLTDAAVVRADVFCGNGYQRVTQEFTHSDGHGGTTVSRSYGCQPTFSTLKAQCRSLGMGVGFEATHRDRALPYCAPSAPSALPDGREFAVALDAGFEQRVRLSGILGPASSLYRCDWYGDADQSDDPLATNINAYTVPPGETVYGVCRVRQGNGQITVVAKAADGTS